MEKIFKQKKGITLIALVITIIVLLILAGISISMLSGDNGILQRSADAKERNGVAEVVEKAKLNILAQIADNKGANISKDQLKTILNTYFENIATLDLPDDLSNTDIKLNANQTYGGYKNIALVDIYNGNFTTEQIISKEDSFVGYYADFEADGTVDGIIYADLAKGNTGTGTDYGDFSYTIPVITGLKNYYVSKTDYEGNFGKKDVLSPLGAGNERFYVMSLNDFSSDKFTWYAGASKNLITNCISDTTRLFNKGKSNTNTLITKWETKAFGEQNQHSSYRDLWGEIKASVNSDWFIPSDGEWAAVVGELGIDDSNYLDYGFIGGNYWSSSCYEDESGHPMAGYMLLDDGAYLSGTYVGLGAEEPFASSIRLSKTF